MRLEHAERRAGLLLGFLVILFLSFPVVARGEHAPAGMTLYIGRRDVDVDVFESSAPIRANEQPKPAVVFDKSLLPSTYETPHLETWPHKYLKIVRPYDGASFPRNIAPPRFCWEDRLNNLWRVSLTAPGWNAPLRVVTNKREWRPDAETWNAIKESGTGDWIDLELRGCLVQGRQRKGDEVYVDSVRLRVSEHPADPIIVYRLVSPLFHGSKTPHVYYRDIGTFEVRMFLPSNGLYCTNCHVFPGSPTLEQKDLTLAIAVRESFKGLRILGMYHFDSQRAKTLSINSFFMSWHPESGKIAVTGGDSISSRPLITLETQEFDVLLADILIVDSKTLKAEPLPGASEPTYMETFPTWSPDGKTMVFSRAPEVHMLERLAEVKYDLYRVPYNDGNGGVATPIEGASQNGMSNFAARYSRDGKWIVFNKADSSTLVKPTAHLWILSTEEGALPRKLECNCEYAMDSHHSWSSNSRWLLFSSKRDDGIFARVYLTEIDEEGHASPPVALPALDDDIMMCYNVPEFLQYRPKIDAEDIVRKVSRLEK